ncbi:hypothetical protein [Streptomyces sp. NPDC006997]|uniref:hypothetical protein n=1 Tax=Streptomyces sp. NPDC006997 TaxID=3155356 RepID=UPI0033E71AE8
MPVGPDIPGGRPGEPSADPFEGRLEAALREAGGGFETDGAALVTAGQARGRRLRLRRRAAVLGSVASLALVGVGGALVLPGSGGGSGAEEASPAASRQQVATSPTAPAVDPVTGDAMLTALKELLPDGDVSQEQSGGGSQGSAYATVVYDDGQGGGALGVTVDLMDPRDEGTAQMTTCPDKTAVSYDSCDSTKLSDGSALMLLQGYEYPDRRVDTKLWQAHLVTPEGYHVSVAEWNAEAEKDAPVTRPEPPLTLAQLETIATADVWRDAAASLPGNPKGVPDGGETRPEVPPVTGPPVLEVLTDKLPEGLHVVSQEGGDSVEYGYVIVDDGDGRSLVSVQVQTGMSDVADDLFGPDDETLGDGTRVAERQRPGEKGGEGVVWWTVDTLRPGPNGERVIVDAFNSEAQHTAATREEPALTMAQLREIALDPRWFN